MKLRFRIFLPYIILLAMTVVAAFFFYGRVIGAYTESKASQNIHIMKRGMADLERKIESLKLNQYALSTSTGLRQIKKLDNPIFGSSVILLDEFYKDLQLVDEKDYQNEIQDFGVFFLTNRLVINRKGIYKFEEYYENFFLYNNMPYGKWRTFLQERSYSYHITPLATLEINGEEYLGNLLLYTYGVNRTSRDAVLYYNLKEDFFLSPFADLNRDEDGTIYAVNGQGELMFGSLPVLNSGKIEMGGSGYLRQQDRILSYVKSSDLEWTFVYEQSYKILFSEILVIRNFSIIFSILYLIITIGVSLFFIRRNYRLFEELFVLMKGRFKPDRKQIDLYDQIRESLIELQDERRSLISRDQEQAVLLRNHIFTSLLEGTQNHWEEDLLNRYLPGDRTEERYAVSIIYRENGKGHYGDVPSFFITEDILGENLSSLLFYTRKSGSTVIIHRTDLQDCAQAQEKFTRELNLLARKVVESREGNFYAALGEAVPGISGIAISYAQASQTASYILKQGITGTHSYNSDDLAWDISLSAGQINILSAAVISHDVIKIENCFISWENQYTDESRLLIHRQFFLTNLYLSVIQFLSEMGDGDGAVQWDPAFFGRIHDFNEVRRLLTNLKEECLKISDQREDQKNSHNRGLHEKIKEYIHSEFGNSNLNALMIADIFEISELYFYRFFKEQEGATFADYLENLRLEEAKRLLGESYKIKEVGQITGYNSSTAFGRAFKRKWGITAGDYRDSLM